MKNAALLLARRDSKGLPGKNQREFLGKPLFRYGLDAALHSDRIDHVFASSDNQEILDHAASRGATPLQRPAHLALDETEMIQVVMHERARILDAVGDLEFLIITLGNSPCQTDVMMTECIDLARRRPDASAVIPVSRYDHWTPQRAIRMDDDNSLAPWMPELSAHNFADSNSNRQSSPITYFACNSFFVVRSSSLDTYADSPFPMPWFGTSPVGYLDPFGGLDIDGYPDLWSATGWWSEHSRSMLDPGAVKLELGDFR